MPSRLAGFCADRIIRRVGVHDQLNRDFSFNEILYKVRKCIEDDKHILLKSGCNLNPQDIDNYIGLFELMTIYEQHGIIDTKLMDDSFGVYVEDAYKNMEIQQYIVETRKTYKGDNSLYSGFEGWAKRLIEVSTKPGK